MKWCVYILSFFLFADTLGQHRSETLPYDFYKSVQQKADSLFNDFGLAAPGSAVLIIHHGNIIVNKGHGLSNLEQGLAITSKTVFDLASVSKMFTGYAIGSLLLDKKISLNDDIRQYIPELPPYENTITLDHLVHHTSGLKNWTEFLPIAGWSFDDVINTSQILNLTFRQKDLQFIPGSKYEYCNTGYVLLAEIIHRVTGLTLKEWSYRNIFLPLGMTSTSILDDHTLIIPSKAQSYYTGRDGQFHRSPTSCSVPGSSSVHSNTDDLAKWLLFLDDPGDKQKIIDLMYTPGKLNNGQSIDYGLGVILKTFRNAAVRRHEGFWPSYGSYLFTVPEYSLSIVILNNSTQQSYRELVQLAGMFLPDEDEVKPGNERKSSDIVPSPSTLKTYEGTYRGGPGWYLNVFLQNSKLNVQATGDDAYEMRPLSDSVFYVAEFQDTIAFLHAKQSIALKLKRKIHPKIQVHNTSREEQQRLIGKYCSDELQTCYEVIDRDKSLSLFHPRLGNFKLTPGFNFDFTISGAERWFPAALEFKTNQNKRNEKEMLILGGYQFIKTK